MRELAFWSAHRGPGGRSTPHAPPERPVAAFRAGSSFTGARSGRSNGFWPLAFVLDRELADERDVVRLTYAVLVASPCGWARLKEGVNLDQAAVRDFVIDGEDVAGSPGARASRLHAYLTLCARGSPAVILATAPDGAVV